MNTKTLSKRALSVIDQYLHLQVGSAVSPVPYFNNKTVRARASLRANIGKGSPKDIVEEVTTIAMTAHIQLDSWASESLTKLLVDNNLGIDCSGFAYYVLNAESEDSGKGHLDKHISFVMCSGMFGKMRCAMRPVENCGVNTLAHERNSRIIPLNEIVPGDLISMLAQMSPSANSPIRTIDPERDHILVIHQVEYQNYVPYKLHYSHAVAYPEDGVYGSGVRQGTIEIADLSKDITEALWIENGKTGGENRIYMRAKKSKTEVRRLSWL